VIFRQQFGNVAHSRGHLAAQETRQHASGAKGNEVAFIAQVPTEQTPLEQSVVCTVYVHMRIGIVFPLLSLWTCFSCSPSFASTLRASPAASPQDKNTSQKARETLQASALAYQQVVALSDVLTYIVTTPNAVLPPKTLKMTLGSRPRVALEDPLIEAVALDGSLFVTKSDAPGKYVVRPYSGDFAKALDGVVGEQGWPLEPLQIAMRLGKGIDGWLTALRFKQLAPLQISGYEKKTDNGRWFDEIHFRAENGWLDADFDSTTHFLSRILFEAHPQGAPKDVFIKVSGECAPKVLASAKDLVTFDPSEKVAVADLTSLDAAQLPTGKLAPPFELENLAGRKVSLRQFKGSVVVLDFWASWCAPCWKTLRATQDFSDWASHSGLPIVVFPVDTMEQFLTTEETRVKATEFFQSQSLTMSSLVDLNSETFRAFGTPGLPSMVIIAADGTIYKYHQGSFPNMLETLKREAKDAGRAAAN
jgi:peroxiredoxin